jgi:hypothetical protein
VTRPPLRRRLGALAIDLAVLLIAAPLLLGTLAFIATYAFDASTRGDCVSPCDGSALAFTSAAFLVLLLVWALYWPVLIYWRRRTVGSSLVGLEFRGDGLTRRLAWREPADG